MKTGYGAFWLQVETRNPFRNFTEAGHRRYWTITKRGIYFVSPAKQPPYPIRLYDFSTTEIQEIAITDKSPIWIYPELSALDKGTSLLYSHSDQNASNIMLAELPENSN